MGGARYRIERWTSTLEIIAIGKIVREMYIPANDGRITFVNTTARFESTRPFLHSYNLEICCLPSVRYPHSVSRLFGVEYEASLTADLPPVRAWSLCFTARQEYFSL
jgi:hypothetical protein